MKKWEKLKKQPFLPLSFVGFPVASHPKHLSCEKQEAPASEGVGTRKEMFHRALRCWAQGRLETVAIKPLKSSQIVRKKTNKIVLSALAYMQVIISLC